MPSSDPPKAFNTGQKSQIILFKQTALFFKIDWGGLLPGMQTFKKSKVRRIAKVANIVVTLSMVLQPVGTPGILGAILIADKAVAQSTDVQPADQSSATSPDSSSPKTDSTATTKDDSSKSDTTTSGNTSTNADTTSGATQTGGTNPDSTTSNAATTDSGTQNSDSSANTVSNATNDNSSGTISPDAASTSQPTTEKNGQICLDSGAKIVDSSKSDWDVNGDTTETKNKVELGVKYIFPLNDKVSVTFTCLPSASADRTTLKIQQIASSDINLPDGVSAATDFAYDITTGMKNGDFKYDLTLPKSDVAGADINYIEKTANEVKNQDITTSDLKSVDETKVKEGSNDVKVEELDHFTIFLVTWNFPNNPDNAIADGGTAANLTKTITAVGTNAPSFNTSGATTNSASATGWDGGSGIKYWQVEFDSSGYNNLKFSSKQRSSDTGPKNFKVQYKIGSGGSWTDVASGSVTVADNFTSGVISSLSLLSSLNNQSSVYLRWIMTSNTAVGGGTVGSSGTSRIDDIIVQGGISWPTTWNTPNSCVSDPSGDENPSEIDIVGDSSNPAVGFNSDNDYQYFRERLNGNPGSFVQKAWVVLFQTSSPQYQYLGSLNGKDDKVQLWKNTSAAGPVDFSPILNDPAEDIVWEGSASDYARSVSAGSGKYYVDWAIPKAELTSRGINTDTIKFFATSADANNFNKDHLKCYEVMSDLSITKSDNPDPVTSGGTLTYTLSIHNGGPDAASGVVVTDTLPSGYSVTSVTSSQGSCSDVTAPSIQCELGSMANGANATITVTGTIVGLGTVTNTTSVSLDTSVSIDTNPNNNTDSEDTTINPSAGNLVVHKTFTDSHSNSGITINVSPGSLTQVTDSNGDATFNNLSAGAYTATATEPAGYYQSATTCSGVQVVAGQTASCTITDSPISGTITVHKTIVGGTATPSEFCFTLSPDPANIGEICANNITGNAVFNNVSAGTYSVNETTVAANYTETGNTCSNLAIVNNDDSKSCEVTNTRNTGTLRVLKNVDLNGDGDYTDPGETGATDWKWQANGGVDHNTGDPAITFDTGNYALTETAKTDFHPVDLTCENGTLSGNTVTVSKDANVVCTFTNARDTGTLEVIKTADFGPLSQWYFSLDSATPVQATSGGIVTYLKVPTGSHSVAESGPTTDFDLDSITCDKTYTTPDLANKSVSTVVEANDTTTCYFNNLVNRAQITIIKNAVPDSSQIFGFTSDITGYLGFNLDDDGDNSDGISNTEPITGLLPGTYSVSETQPVDGWDLGLIECTLNGQTLSPINGNAVTRTLDAGDSLSCTFTNTERGSISGMKFNDINGNGAKDTGDNGLLNWTIFIDKDNNQTLDVGETSTTTPANGSYQFQSLVPDDYSVCEVEQPAAWQRTKPASSNCQTVTVGAGQDVENIDFGNFKLGEITVCKYNDYNGNGNYDSQDDQPLAGISMKLSKEISGNLVLQTSQDTGEDGCTTFAGLTAGQYRVEEDYTDPDLAGYYSTNSVTQYDVNVASGTDETRNFLNALYRTISGTKFNDLNGNGVKDTGEPGLENWTIFIDFNNSGTLDAGEPSVTTDVNGNYQFTNLVSDSYTIAEVLEPGWTQTLPAAGHYDVDVHTAVTSTGNDFGNVQLSAIHGYKWNDLDGNGSQNGEEPKLSGWEIFIDKNDNSTWDSGEPKTTTSSDSNPAHFGWYWFENLLPGQYKVCEVQQTGWTQTYPTPQCHTITLPENSSEQSTNFVTAPEHNFGNQFTPPGLRIDKFNDAIGAKSPGDSVTYTLVIKAKGIADDDVTLTTNTSNVENVHVTDLPPAGFIYRPGSWTANSDVRGDIKNSPTTEPTYHSPGDWSLGTMVPDEEVTLTYVADISTSQESGTYPDLAWAAGTDLLGKNVQATQGDPVFFAGTEVAVVRKGEVLGASVKIPTDRKTHHRHKRIVRKTKVLPATGMSPLWPAAGVLLLTLGGIMLILGRDKRRRKFKNMTKSAYKSLFLTLLFSVLAIGVLGVAKSAYAADPPRISASMETPASSYNTTDFTLGFVALDVDSKPITVDCFLGSSVVPFETINLGTGGTSGSCHGNLSGILGDGAYDFHIVATSDNGTATAGPVTVNVKTGGPGTPTNYDRNDTSACHHIISFTTANDGGRTVRAEIYRSPNTSFNADAGTLITNITGLTSNQPVSYEDIIPSNCGRFFYAVRAFDALGNGSGVVGDTRTVTTTTGGGTTTITTTTTAAGGGAIPVGGGAAAGGAAAGGGAVAGEETAPGGEGQNPPTIPGQVLGEEQAKSPFTEFLKAHKVLSTILALIILGILYYVYLLIQRRRRNSKLPPQTPLAGPPEPPQTPPASQD